MTLRRLWQPLTIFAFCLAVFTPVLETRAASLGSYFPPGAGLAEYRTSVGIPAQIEYGADGAVTLSISTLRWRLLHNAQGLHLLGSSDSSDGFQETFRAPFLVLPANLPASYSNQGTYDGTMDGDSYTGFSRVTTTVAGTESVTVPVGTFQALKVVFQEYWEDDDGSSDTDSWTMWFAPNVGVVKLTSVGEITITLEAERLPQGQAPVITMQPSSQTVFVGDTVTLAATVTGSPPLSYQWRKGRFNIQGATGPTLTLQNVSTNDAGTYTLTVNNAFGSATSQTVTVVVLRREDPIAFGPLADRTLFESPFRVGAFRASGLPVSIAVVSGPAGIGAPGFIVLRGEGVVTLRAYHEGDSTYTPAAVDLSFKVHPGTLPKIVSLSPEGVLTWTTPNLGPVAYHIEAAGSLDSSWSIEKTVQSASGLQEKMTTQVAPAAAGARFYRVRMDASAASP